MSINYRDVPKVGLTFLLAMFTSLAVQATINTFISQATTNVMILWFIVLILGIIVVTVDVNIHNENKKLNNNNTKKNTESLSSLALTTKL